MNNTFKQDEIYELQNKVTMLTDENDELKTELSKLKEQIEEFRVMYISTIEYASSIENELENKVKSLSENNSNGSECTVQPHTINLKEKLALEISRNEKLIEENQKLKERIEQIRLLYVNTTHHATILENELDQKYQEVTQLSITDPLTGIYNRLKFHRSFHLNINLAQQEKSDLSLIMFDIDKFKLVNDNYGHERGDSVLKTITGIVKSVIRKEDIFARWGGEEFMILIPKSNMENTRKLAERIRKKIAAYSFEEVGSVTCSFGVTEFDSKLTAEQVIKRVDEALYLAKEEGRNRVVCK